MNWQDPEIAGRCPAAVAGSANLRRASVISRSSIERPGCGMDLDARTHPVELLFESDVLGELFGDAFDAIPNSWRRTVRGDQPFRIDGG
ncbi:hypothetical protein [Micromonospora endophytica]|uniref:hypothetical protein n=1 Tax=Micromonospora endophytica TaxID=515350 RepID=UPI0011B79509|nr:hypothetical protein [Micromonospora endophytica]